MNNRMLAIVFVVVMGGLCLFLNKKNPSNTARKITLKIERMMKQYGL